MQWFWFAILAALCWGSAPIFEKVGIGKMSPLVAVTVRSVVISIILIISVILTKEITTIPRVELKSLIYIAIGGILAGLLGQVFYFAALKLGESSRVVPVCGTYPLIAAVLGISLLGEALTIPKIVGIILIVAGIILVR
ncbi:MAG: EamA family transporter [Actinomycetota bacterium]|nr:EamA family transporter [Actinomycetota bacterium]MDI6821586.1 EamA family transporter [Actinomycetota bacterium]